MDTKEEVKETKIEEPNQENIQETTQEEKPKVRKGFKHYNSKDYIQYETINGVRYKKVSAEDKDEFSKLVHIENQEMIRQPSEYIKPEDPRTPEEKKDDELFKEFSLVVLDNPLAEKKDADLKAFQEYKNKIHSINEEINREKGIPFDEITGHMRVAYHCDKKLNINEFDITAFHELHPLESAKKVKYYMEKNKEKKSK